MSIFDEASALAQTAVEMGLHPVRAVGTAVDYYSSHPDVTAAAQDAARAVVSAPVETAKTVGRGVAKGVAIATAPAAHAAEHAADAISELGHAALDAAERQGKIGAVVVFGLGAVALGAWAWSRKRS